MFPIKDDNPRRRTPIVTLALIASMLSVWFFVQDAGQGVAYARSICELGLIPGELTGLGIGTSIPLGDGMACTVGNAPNWYTALSSMFVHADWFHLIGNLWFLWLFGDNVEDQLGRFAYLVFYLACGIAAAVAQLVIDPSNPVPMVGASGAISGVMGAYVVMYPLAPVRVFILVIVIPIFFRLPAIVMLGYWFVLQLLGALPQLGGGAAAGIAFWAHLGGFVSGVVIALWCTSRGSARYREVIDERSWT